MAIRCTILGHAPIEPGLFNGGLYFTRCKACDADMIHQQGGPWLPLPPRLRVRWAKDGQHSVTPWEAAKLAHRRRK